jgi:hypothetical protein
VIIDPLDSYLEDSIFEKIQNSRKKTTEKSTKMRTYPIVNLFLKNKKIPRKLIPYPKCKHMIPKKNFLISKFNFLTLNKWQNSTRHWKKLFPMKGRKSLLAGIISKMKTITSREYTEVKMHFPISLDKRNFLL